MSIPFNPLFNPLIIEDDDIKVSTGKTDKTATKKKPEEASMPVNVQALHPAPAPTGKPLAFKKKKKAPGSSSEGLPAAGEREGFREEGKTNTVLTP